MARLNWGVFGERVYEVGTDRGVLYVSGFAGVPWNGLISVKESPKGGSPTPFYIDGYRYIQVASAEEFEATIQAYSSPLEFGLCDGVAAISNGLFATQQPRKEFGLSYRTKIGNDAEGLELGYKIHLVYGAMAGPASRDNSSIDKSVDPLKLSWPVETVAPLLVGRRPTAHFIVDSRFTSSVLLLELEDILYGSETNDPTLPTASELVSMFSA